MNAKRNSVRVTILNEEYAIRSDASSEHTREVAQYVDRAIRQVMNSGMVVESNKAAILAALQIAGELFEARAAANDLTRSMHSLADEVRPRLGEEGRSLSAKPASPNLQTSNL
jgi:cell division protein ZapA